MRVSFIRLNPDDAEQSQAEQKEVPAKQAKRNFIKYNPKKNTTRAEHWTAKWMKCQKCNVSKSWVLLSWARSMSAQRLHTHTHVCILYVVHVTIASVYFYRCFSFGKYRVPAELKKIRLRIVQDLKLLLSVCFARSFPKVEIVILSHSLPFLHLICCVLVAHLSFTMDFQKEAKFCTYPNFEQTFIHFEQ